MGFHRSAATIRRFHLPSAKRRPDQPLAGGIARRPGSGVRSDFLQTSNGGKTWSSTATIGVGPGITSPNASDAWAPFGCLPSCAAATSARNQLIRTDDGGNDWVAVPLPQGFDTGKEGYQSFQLVSPDVGFALISPPCPEGFHRCPVWLYRSTDRGTSFVQLPARVM